MIGGFQHVDGVLLSTTLPMSNLWSLELLKAEGQQSTSNLFSIR